jgi:hypothetical protein
MDNSRDFKTHAGCRLNERFNQAPQIYSSVLFFFYTFDLENYRLVLSLSVSLSLVLVVPIFFKSTNHLGRKKTDGHSREIEHLSVKGHCPIKA